MVRAFPVYLSVWAASLVVLSSVVQAANISEIGPDNRDPIQGKEVDWIDGDYVIQNDQLVAVIARPGELRDANMTVRGVGACVIDLSRFDRQSDQLSCFYPTAGRYQFFDDGLVEHGQNADGGVFWRCKSSASVAGDGSTATVEYLLRDGEPFLTMRVQIEGGDLDKVKPIDGIRADRTFQFDSIDASKVAFCEDEYFRQTYGFQSGNAESAPTWSNDRMRQLRYGAAALTRSPQQVAWVTRIYPASCSLDLWGMIQGGTPQTFFVRGAIGDQPRIKLSLLEGIADGLKLPAVWRSDADGKSTVHLPPGEYRIQAEAIGHESSEVAIRVGNQPAEHSIELGAATRVVAKITDEAGQPIPCKVTFYGAKTPAGNETADPMFGLDSQSGSVGNCVYTADGEFVRSIPPGSYEVLISRGPEYDVEFQKLELGPGSEVQLNASLKRVVDTTGWVSAELHSHSTPSGDNTSEQLGRVENLICEHLEFAPCTEHQRIESYDDQLEILGAERFMATCSGMELTGSLLPINHQNAFPLKLSPFVQDGGGPRTDNSDPVNQIARLAMWDDNSEKVVQSNHPNMRQLLFDRDLDGTDDGGFAKMVDYMDIIEVHPPELIFLSDEETAALKVPDTNRMKPWMNLIRTGRRIPGVVNTDAHYNWHGSGSLRNWIRSSTDDPAQITTEEMTQRLEGGQIVMSTGPFMTVQLHHGDLSKPAEVGDSVQISDNTAELEVRIQCANWLDVNRVEVFVNGERQPQLARTRAEHPDAFGSGVTKFDQRLTVTLPRHAFVIVAAIGERMQLGRVMGESEGKRPPVVVSNPIYVTADVQGADAQPSDAQPSDSQGADASAGDGVHLFVLSGQSNMQGHRPQEAFTPAVSAALGKTNVIVVQDALGGQPIQRWYKEWKAPDGTSPKSTGDLYDRLMSKVQPEIQGKQLASVTLIWMQGERDAKMKWGSVYGESLIGLYRQFCRDLGRDDVNFVIGRLSDFDMENKRYPEWTRLREIQVQVAESNSRFAWVNTDDLNDGVNRAGKPIRDDLHYSADGYKVLGKRFAETALELIRMQP